MYWGIKSCRNVYSKLSHPKLERKVQSLSPQCSFCGCREEQLGVKREEKRTLLWGRREARGAGLPESAVAGAADTGIPPEGPLPLSAAEPRSPPAARRLQPGPAGKQRGGGSRPGFPPPAPRQTTRSRSAPARLPGRLLPPRTLAWAAPARRLHSTGPASAGATARPSSGDLLLPPAVARSSPRRRGPGRPAAEEVPVRGGRERIGRPQQRGASPPWQRAARGGGSAAGGTVTHPESVAQLRMSPRSSRRHTHAPNRNSADHCGAGRGRASLYWGAEPQGSHASRPRPSSRCAVVGKSLKEATAAGGPVGALRRCSGGRRREGAGLAGHGRGLQGAAAGDWALAAMSALLGRPARMAADASARQRCWRGAAHASAHAPPPAGCASPAASGLSDGRVRRTASARGWAGRRAGRGAAALRRGAEAARPRGSSLWVSAGRRAPAGGTRGGGGGKPLSRLGRRFPVPPPPSGRAGPGPAAPGPPGRLVAAPLPGAACCGSCCGHKGSGELVLAARERFAVAGNTRPSVSPGGEKYQHFNRCTIASVGVRFHELCVEINPSSCVMTYWTSWISVCGFSQTW